MLILQSRIFTDLTHGYMIVNLSIVVGVIIPQALIKLFAF